MRNPAGVLYLLADPAPKTTNRQQAQQDVQYELDGLVRDEQKVFDAMDADETGCYLPLATATVYPAPARRISVPILQSSTASSCIWMILSPRWASSFTMADRCRTTGGRGGREPLRLVRLQLYLLPRDRHRRAGTGSPGQAF